jgi:nitric oxide reductase NorD protein
LTTVSPHPLDALRLADPDTYVWVKGKVELMVPPPGASALRLLADQTIWGLSVETAMGTALARGILDLLPCSAMPRLHRYVQMVRRASDTGITLGRIVAEFSAAVVSAGEPLTRQFETTMAVMLGKGTYALRAPFEVLRELLQAGDLVSAAAYLDLLDAAFRKDLTYNQSLQLVYLLPKSVRRLAARRRHFQIEQLTAVVTVNLRLVDAYLEGLAKGAALLDKGALRRFVSQAMERFERKAELGIKFLSLSSKVGQDACLALQRAVPLVHVNGQLSRYLQARLGYSVRLEPLSGLGGLAAEIAWVCSDGQSIYLPDEVERFDRRRRNIGFYKFLVRLEAALFECRTFDFDLERAADVHPGFSEKMPLAMPLRRIDGMCDGEQFVRAFPLPLLAGDLFTLYEHARLGAFLRKQYPGLMRQTQPLLDAEARVCIQANASHLLAPVALHLLLSRQAPFSTDPSTADLQRELIALFDPSMASPLGVETSAFRACLAYARSSRWYAGSQGRYRPFRFPHDRRLRWELVSRAMSVHDRSAALIQQRLEEQGLTVYRSELRNRLADQQGRLSAEDVTALVLSRCAAARQPGTPVHLSSRQLDKLLQLSGLERPPTAEAPGDAYRYPEWDNTVQDYLFDHTRVRESEIPVQNGAERYQRILQRHGGLVSRMRHAFALLKPEGITMLRQWPEGDAVDYRALLDYVMDRRAGRMPSERLFIKRLKQERDVAVVVLVDLSRSTANPAAGGNASVLDVTKEALVLFCEALQVVGDSYAIAGFSGTGRHSVDYYHIKRVEEPLSDAVRSRISYLSPQRSTRMGAAVRHATALLGEVQRRVRLLIVISDGFPNDLGYKADYAIADTRRAVSEARASNFHVKAITVNIGSDPGLDALYGRVHHHVIENVRDLPDKLLRLYGTLTRF